MEAGLAAVNLAEILQTVKDLKDQVSSLAAQLTERPCHCHKSRRQHSKKKQSTHRAPLSETGREGTIKWYSRRLAYGFITRCDNGQDIFVHRSALPAQQRRSTRPLEGAEVTFSVRHTRKGPEAAAVKLRRCRQRRDTPVPIAVPPHHGTGDGTQQPPLSGDGGGDVAAASVIEAAPVTSCITATQRDADRRLAVDVSRGSATVARTTGPLDNAAGYTAASDRLGSEGGSSADIFVDALSDPEPVLAAAPAHVTAKCATPRVAKETPSSGPRLEPSVEAMVDDLMNKIKKFLPPPSASDNPVGSYQLSPVATEFSPRDRHGVGSPYSSYR